MALFDNASLVTTPNGYKAGTLYSIKPTSGAGDMTVVRATTATRVNSAGLIESVANNVPRLDYSNGTCPSILVEPQRTNVVLYSEQFDNAAWTASASNATVTANTTISPDGTQNADTVVFGASGYLYQQFSITGLASATFSIYAKTTTQIPLFGGATPAGTDVYTILNVGNGWYRQILTRTFTGGGTGILQILPFGNNITAFLWGCQVELASYATSYIPTTSAAVTRNADDISKTGISSLIGQTEGTVFCEINTQVSTDFNCFQILDGTSDNWVFIGLSANKIRAFIRFGATTIFDSNTFVLTNGVSYKAAIAYKNGDLVFYINGVQIVSSAASFTVTAPISYSAIGFLLSGPTEAAKYNSGAIFPTRLTNAELATLTTI